MRDYIERWLDLMVRRGRMARALVFRPVKEEALRAEEGGPPRKGMTLREKKQEVREARYS